MQNLGKYKGLLETVLQKKYTVDLGIGKGDFVKVHQQEGKIVIEKV